MDTSSRQGQFPASFPETFKNFFSMLNEEEDHVELFSNLEDKVIPRPNKCIYRGSGNAIILGCSGNEETGDGNGGGGVGVDGGGVGAGGISSRFRNNSPNVGRSSSFRVPRTRPDYCKHMKYCCLNQQKQPPPTSPSHQYNKHHYHHQQHQQQQQQQQQKQQQHHHKDYSQQPHIHHQQQHHKSHHQHQQQQLQQQIQQQQHHHHNINQQTELFLHHTDVDDLPTPDYNISDDEKHRKSSTTTIITKSLTPVTSITRKCASTAKMPATCDADNYDDSDTVSICSSNLTTSSYSCLLQRSKTGGGGGGVGGSVGGGSYDTRTSGGGGGIGSGDVIGFNGGNTVSNSSNVVKGLSSTITTGNSRRFSCGGSSGGGIISGCGGDAGVGCIMPSAKYSDSSVFMKSRPLSNTNKCLSDKINLCCCNSSNTSSGGPANIITTENNPTSTINTSNTPIVKDIKSSKSPIFVRKRSSSIAGPTHDSILDDQVFWKNTPFDQHFRERYSDGRSPVNPCPSSNSFLNNSNNTTGGGGGSMKNNKNINNSSSNTNNQICGSQMIGGGSSSNSNNYNNISNQKIINNDDTEGSHTPLPSTLKQKQRMRTSSMPVENRKPRLADTRRAAIHCADMDLEYYRLRSFSITSHGICNLGDSMRSRRSRSITSVTSNTTLASKKDRKNSNTSQLSNDGIVDGGGGGATAGGSTVDEKSQAKSVLAYKVAMLGESGVGKTALTYQFTTSDYICAYDLSLDDDYGQKTVSVLLDGTETDLEIIDHPACEMSTEAFCSTYNIDIFVVVYSVVDRKTFKAAEKVLHYLKESEMLLTRGAILVGNKTDLERHREVPRQAGRRVAKEVACKFIETSSGLDHNVNELLVGIVAQVKLNPQRIRNLTEAQRISLAGTSTCIQKRRNPATEFEIKRKITSTKNNNSDNFRKTNVNNRQQFDKVGIKKKGKINNKNNNCDSSNNKIYNENDDEDNKDHDDNDDDDDDNDGGENVGDREDNDGDDDGDDDDDDEDDDRDDNDDDQLLFGIDDLKYNTNERKKIIEKRNSDRIITTKEFNIGHPSSSTGNLLSPKKKVLLPQKPSSASAATSSTSSNQKKVLSTNASGTNSVNNPNSAEPQKSPSKMSLRTKYLLTSFLKFKRTLRAKRRNSNSCSDLFVI